MPDKLNVAIVGLGLIGASAGLALRKYQDKVSVVGHDAKPELAGKAKKAGAVERTEWNLINTVSSADRVILALPLSEIRATLDAIKLDLRPGCIVMDMADVKAPVMQWAAELLPAEVHFVGGHPIILSETIEPEGARADLFNGKLFCLTPSPNTEGTAVQLAADVAEALGAKPFFLSAEEHDGLVAAVEQMPSLLAAALMSVTSSSPGWNDMRKLAGNQFFASTMMVSQSGKEAVAGPLANRENTVYWLDAMISELASYRDQLAGGAADDLVARVDQGIAAGQSWLTATQTGNWDVDATAVEMPTAGSTMRDMFFGRRNPQGRGKQGEQGKRK